MDTPTQDPFGDALRALRHIPDERPPVLRLAIDGEVSHRRRATEQHVPLYTFTSPHPWADRAAGVRA